MTDPSEEMIERLNAALEGRYRIEGELGAGGMATVYLAEDLRHDRKVAIKVLRPELAAVVGAERFLAEIKTTANLQHPHILPLHDSGEADTFLFYVMPHVEGESLRGLLDRERQLPVDEAVRITKAIASALDYAHRKGVIHRDIKPANILLQDGQPVVADFGIALAVQQAGAGRLTETGLSLGTPYYMSPEQATGDRDPDARSDLYSLGCMAYEMLAGEPPFTGNTAQSVLAKILTADAPMVSQVRSTVPPHVAAAIRKATQRLPADRFATVGEFGAALDTPGFTTAVGTQSVGGDAAGATPGTDHVPGGTRAPAWRTAAGIAGAAAIAFLGLWLNARAGAPEPGPVMRVFLTMPDSQQVINPTAGPSVQISADGSTLVYAGPSGSAITQLWVKRRDQLEGQPIRGTENTSMFAVSPDGSEVAFMQEGARGILALPTTGGAPRTLADSARNLAGDWARDGYVYFQNPRTGLSRVPEAGGPVEELTEGSGMQGAGDNTWIDVFPDGSGAVFTRWGSVASRDSIMAINFETGETRSLAGGVTARYSPTGHILFATADGVLMAAPFDTRSLQITGPTITLVQDIRMGADGEADFSLSDEGTLIYQTGAGLEKQVVWVTRDGDEEPVEEGWVDDVSSLAIAPDGRKLAVEVTRSGRSDIWTKRLDRPTAPLQRLTFEGEGVIRPAWMPDSETVLFLATEEETQEAFAKPWDGTGDVVRMVSADQTGTGHVVNEIIASSDGEWLVYRVGAGANNRSIYGIRLTGDSAVVPLVDTQYDEHSAALSPDNRWLAYVSDESGQAEVYVRPFPDVDSGLWLISTGGGREPVWSADGTELYFRNGRGEFVAAAIGIDQDQVSVRSLTPLFPMLGYERDDVHAAYAVDPAGSGRFLMIKRLGDIFGRIVMVQNLGGDLPQPDGD